MTTNTTSSTTTNAGPKLPVIISDNAKNQMRAEHMPPYQVLAIARKANDWGDGNYKTATGCIVVKDRVITEMRHN